MKRFLFFITCMLTLTLAFDFLPEDQNVSDFRFVVIGDRTSSPVEKIFDEIIDEVCLLNPDYVINVGDLIHGYAEDTTVILAQWDTVLTILKKLPCRFHLTPGNHDIQNETDRRIFEDKSGTNDYYSFDFRDNHFIVLNNTITQWVSPQEMDTAQINWLKDDLEMSKHADNIFIFFHVPTYLDAFRNNTPDSLVNLFIRYGVRAVFAGHNHSYLYLNQGGTDFIVVGSSGGDIGNNDFARGNFFHYLTVTVKGKECDIAVIKKGNVFQKNIVTGDNYLALARVDREAVTMTSSLVKEGSKKFYQSVTLTISDLGPDSIRQSVQWHYDSTRYRILPQNMLLAIAPDEKKNNQFHFTVANGSDIYPLARFTLAYPFTYGKVCTLRNYLPVKRLYKVKLVKVPPSIDGLLTDEAWKKIVPITNLGNYDGSALTSAEKTEIFLMHDKDDLYLAARCYESDFAGMQATASEHDGAVYIDDNLWFFFDSDFDQETYYQLMINSKGVTFDRQCSLKDGNSTKDLSWNGPWEIKAGKEDKAWTIELKIPKKGLEPYSEKQWGFSLRRLQNRLGDAYWNIPFGHDPKNFGIIEFE